MTEKLIISISGMRGIVGENLFPQTAVEYGAAFGTFLKRSKGKDLKVCVGRDSRPSGQMIESAVIAGLCSVGVNVVQVGLVITPSVGIMVRELQCDGGVMITASHNPIPYNGIKLILDNGIAPPLKVSQNIKLIYEQKDFSFVGSAESGKVCPDNSAYDIHIEKVISLIDVELIASKNFEVVLDSVNGAGGPVALQMLKKLNCQVTPVNTEPTGIFAHTPEPIAENLVSLSGHVKKSRADIGLAQDPDADRLAIIDENGNFIGEEYSLALVAMYIFGKKKGKAAANLSTSRMIDDIAAKHGSEVIRTAVGEANVAKAMIENDCVIGGEGNGGIIDLRVGPIRDSLVGIAFVLQLMAETGKKVSQLVKEIGGYHMIKEKIRAEKEDAVKIISAAKEKFINANVNETDGCRFDFEDGWLHLRTSNTEPVMRIIAEAKTKESAEKYMKQVKEIIGS